MSAPGRRRRGRAAGCVDRGSERTSRLRRGDFDGTTAAPRALESPAPGAFAWAPDPAISRPTSGGGVIAAIGAGTSGGAGSSSVSWIDAAAGGVADGRGAEAPVIGAGSFSPDAIVTVA